MLTSDHLVSPPVVVLALADDVIEKNQDGATKPYGKRRGEYRRKNGAKRKEGCTSSLVAR